MFKPKRLTPTATPDKTPPDKPLVELTEDQLKAIAGGFGGCGSNCTGNHNETMVSNSILKQELTFKPKLKLLATPDKTRPEKPLVELTEAQLEAIARKRTGSRQSLEDLEEVVATVRDAAAITMRRW